MSIEPWLVGRVHARAVLWRSALLIGVMLLAGGRARCRVRRAWPVLGVRACRWRTGGDGPLSGAHGPRWWLIVLLALATAALLGGAHAAAPPPWNIAVLATVCLPLPVAATVGLAPAFLALVAPLIAALLALHLLVAGVAWLTGMPRWGTVPADALMVAWPVATTLPIT